MHRLQIVGLFALQVVLGGVLFVVVGTAALIIKLFVDFIKNYGVPETIIDMFHLLELFVFGVDAICFVFFVVAEAVILCKQMVTEIKS